eukprot:TRINITY_DN22600_c0_g1_i1.p1 TRINITY_DN22600_c0_g1~~TRINITY_DN22600_c0_g1_i1.p1  ORF type:complete len:322 (-),score=87.41 TRINITY_DN22600_c0_g1_i1:66-1031(-)
MASHSGIPSFIMDLPIPLVIFAALLGLAVLAKWTFVLVNKFYVYFLRPGKNLKRYGKWAIVTGCTDGIGAAVVEEFARKGLNVILVSRSQSKLDAQAKSIESTYKVQTKTVAIDFNSSNPAIFDPLRTAIEDLDVGILVNNVGASYDHAEYFLELSKEKIEQLIRLNIYSVTEMTYLVLPGMVKRKRGAIINVSSASSLVSEPLYAVYTGTKAFVNNFSVALHYEYKSQGIAVQSQLPAFVTTKLSKLRSTSFFICSPRTYAKAFVAQIGYEPIITTYWTHELQIGLATWLLPLWTLCPFLLSRGKALRARALKRKAEKSQ